MNAVQVQGLSRSLGSVLALDRLDLEVPQGQVHGLLDPNGAGKTTLCKILSTVLLPTAGRAAIKGHDVVREAERVKRGVGIVRREPENFHVFVTTPLPALVFLAIAENAGRGPAGRTGRRWRAWVSESCEG